ncbi:hypothetical protein ABPG72_008828 [Tetrahymena utriculariae]
MQKDPQIRTSRLSLSVIQFFLILKREQKIRIYCVECKQNNFKVYKSKNAFQNEYNLQRQLSSSNLFIPKGVIYSYQQKNLREKEENKIIIKQVELLLSDEKQLISEKFIIKEQQRTLVYLIQVIKLIIL